MQNPIPEVYDISLKPIQVLIHVLLQSDQEGVGLVMSEWRRYRLLPPETRGSFRAAAGVGSRWGREYALALLIVVLDHPFISASVVVVNALLISWTLWVLCCLSGK